MRIRPPRLLLAVAAALALAAGAAPAWAHEEINPKTFPTGQPAFLTLTAANESSADLVKIVLRAPAGLAFGDTTRSPAGWSASRTDDTITWTGGAVKPDTFETWGFEIDGADQPTNLTYKVTLGYAGGKSDDHDVAVTAVAPGAAGAGAAGAGATVTTGDAVPTTSTSPTGTANAASAGGSEGGSDASGTAKAALAVAIVALLVSAGALALGARRRGGAPPANRASGSGAEAGAAQDW